MRHVHKGGGKMAQVGCQVVCCRVCGVHVLPYCPIMPSLYPAFHPDAFAVWLLGGEMEQNEGTADI